MSKELKPLWFPEMCKNGQFFILFSSNLLLVKEMSPENNQFQNNSEFFFF